MPSVPLTLSVPSMKTGVSTHLRRADQPPSPPPAAATRHTPQARRPIMLSMSLTKTGSPHISGAQANHTLSASTLSAPSTLPAPSIKTGSPHTPVAQSHYHLSLQQGQRQSTPHTLDAQTNHALSALNAPSTLNAPSALNKDGVSTHPGRAEPLSFIATARPETVNATHPKRADQSCPQCPQRSQRPQ